MNEISGIRCMWMRGGTSKGGYFRMDDPPTDIQAQNGGVIATRSFIPHRVHDAIGVLGAVSVATACLLERGLASRIASIPEGPEKTISVEHPTGEFTAIATLDAQGQVARAGVLRTARKLFDGVVF